MTIPITQTTLFCVISSVIWFNVCVSYFPFIQAINGFAIELIHRDSPKSPIFNPYKSRYIRLSNSLRRSNISHANMFNLSLTSSTAAQTTVISSTGDYLMKMSIGTPPVEIYLGVDTRSSLTWTRCKACATCNEPNSHRVFDSYASSTYQEIPCRSLNCYILRNLGICQSDSCAYLAYVLDGMLFTSGIFGTDTFSLASTSGEPYSLPDTIFGCGFFEGTDPTRNAGDLLMNVSGQVGLGPGPASLLTSLGDSINGTFAYCLPSIFSNLPGTMSFGNKAVISGPAMVSTPLYVDILNSHYLLGLEAISIEGEIIVVPGRELGSPYNGNIVIDSSSTSTYLPVNVYNQMESILSRLIRLERVQDPTRNLNLCYRTDSIFYAPIITMTFSGTTMFTKADVQLSTLNTFVRTARNVVCFAFVGQPGLSYYGSLVQTNFLISFDINNETVSFQSTDCTKNVN